MIVEVRSYRIIPGRRKEFLEFFTTKAIPALREDGMKVVGPMVDTENPNKFVWLRMFDSIEERTRLKTLFYEGDVWKNEMESIVMPMLDSYDVILCETSHGFVTEGLEGIS
ncbi:MAG: NIPSNAP family protein [Pyrinomonadaceae bacterium]